MTLKNYKFFYLIIILLFVITQVPIDNFLSIFYIVITIIIYLSIKQYQENIKITYSLFFFVLFFFIINVFDNKHIVEKNGIFLPNDFNKSKYSEYDEALFELLNQKFTNSYKDIKGGVGGNYWDSTIIENIFSQNFTFIKKNQFEKKISEINHKNLSSAKIGMINNINLSWEDWLKTTDINRNNAPYFIIYKFIDEYHNNKKLCWQGHAIVISDKLSHSHNQSIKCLKVYEGLEILFYNFNSSLEVELEKNNFSIVLEILSQFLFLFLFLAIIIKKIKNLNFKLLFELALISILSSIYIIYVYYHREIFQYGYMPLEAGMDGLIHEGYGKLLSANLVNFNFYEFFKGNESLYYFMPGLRYVLSIKNILFGDNFNFTILVLIFLPVLFYILLIKFNFKKIHSQIIVFLFIFVKIPYLGFSYDHYIRGGLTNYPETFALILLLIFIICHLNYKFFLAGLVCSIMVFIRPNYLPILIVYFVFNLFDFYNSKNIRNIIYLSLGMSFILLIPLHNLVYGNGDFVLLTSSAIVNLKISLNDYLIFFKNQGLESKIPNHLLNWISTGERGNLFPYILNTYLILNLIFFNTIMIVKNKTNKNTLLISLLALSQQTVFLFYANTGRHAYIPWLLILISNFLIFYNYYNPLEQISKIKYLIKKSK